MADAPKPAPTTRCWRITGQVQGVGYRPFVYRLAVSMSLSGAVRNDPAGVLVTVSGPSHLLDEFARRLETDAPELARVDDVRLLDEGVAAAAEAGFRIEASGAEVRERGRVTVDAAVCADCVRELFDRGDRRQRHPFINCTNCGPRYSIVTDLPYDRPRTTMAGFSMCAACAGEYESPADRRFHAQPVCCPDCGPRLRFLVEGGVDGAGDPVAEAARVLCQGGIVALKGLGGYHLAVDATDGGAVARLRERKGRDAKPLAVMVHDLEAARRLAPLSRDAEELLGSPASPVVLADARNDHPLADGVAPGCHRVGLMLPYTPVHHLLMSEVEVPLVMTSLNRTDDPLVTRDSEAMEALGPLCDALLGNDRRIERAVDDSVLIDAPGGILPLRRARGFVPAPLPLPMAAPEPGLAVGGGLKGTVAIVRGGEAIVSQHLGDLDHALAYRRFLTTIQDLERLFEVRPRWMAADMHPGYPSTGYARKRARKEGLEYIPVQHHHAHLASLLAEHGLAGSIVGLVCDGVGYGLDRAAWGGEILVGDLHDFERVGRLRPLRLPGGDAAAVETGRCGLSWLLDALGPGAKSHPLAAVAIPDAEGRARILDMLDRDLRCPPSSGMGRLFDAAASLLGVCDRNRYEAMSGMRLEALASGASGPAGDGVVPVAGEGPFEMDHRPLLHRLIGMLEKGEAPERIAYLFHDALADALARAAVRAAEAGGLETVGLTGGVFCNALLAELTARRIEQAGPAVLRHRVVPPNDGGVSYGQAAVAAARLRDSREV